MTSCKTRPTRHAIKGDPLVGRTHLSSSHLRSRIQSLRLIGLGPRQEFGLDHFSCEYIWLENWARPVSRRSSADHFSDRVEGICCPGCRIEKHVIML